MQKKKSYSKNSICCDHLEKGILEASMHLENPLMITKGYISS